MTSFITKQGRTKIQFLPEPASEPGILWMEGRDLIPTATISSCMTKTSSKFNVSRQVFMRSTKLSETIHIICSPYDRPDCSFSAKRFVNEWDGAYKAEF